MPTHTSDPSGHTNRPVLDHKDAGTARYIATEKNKAYFHVSPSVGVRTSDIELPSFDCITSENIMTKATGADIKTNSPIQPVKYDINKDVLTVKFKRQSRVLSLQRCRRQGKLYMASWSSYRCWKLYSCWKKAFDEQGTKVYVNSEYVRLHEEVKVPYLVK